MSLTQNLTYLSRARVIPLLTPSSVQTALAVSRVLFESGLGLVEIALRNSFGLATIKTLRREIPELIVGAGSVLTPRLGEQAIQCGAQFLVSPGTTESLLHFAANCSVPFLPGVATVSEIMRVRDFGCDLAKLFPAQAIGGIDLLRSVAGPLPDMKFCPTGGIDARRAADYLALTNVVAVGGSWMAPEALAVAQRFDDIRLLAKQAATL